MVRTAIFTLVCKQSNRGLRSVNFDARKIFHVILGTFTLVCDLCTAFSHNAAMPPMLSWPFLYNGVNVASNGYGTIHNSCKFLGFWNPFPPCTWLKPDLSGSRKKEYSIYFGLEKRIDLLIYGLEQIMVERKFLNFFIRSFFTVGKTVYSCQKSSSSSNHGQTMKRARIA